MKNYIQINKATTNIFGLHTQPRKTNRYTNILKLVLGGGKEKRAGGTTKKSPRLFNPPSPHIRINFMGQQVIYKVDEDD